jgi:transposase
MRAYSLDLRQRVMKVYDEGKWTVGQIAQRFAVGEWWIHKLKRQRQREGSIAPRKGKVGQPRRFEGRQLRRLQRYVGRHPDATLEQIQEGLKAPCTLPTIHNTLRRLGYRFKKNAAGQRTRST